MANNRAASWLALKISGSFRHGIHLLPKEDAQSDSCGNKKQLASCSVLIFSHSRHMRFEHCNTEVYFLASRRDLGTAWMQLAMSAGLPVETEIGMDTHAMMFATNCVLRMTGFLKSTDSITKYSKESETNKWVLWSAMLVKQRNRCIFWSQSAASSWNFNSFWSNHHSKFLQPNRRVISASKANALHKSDRFILDHVGVFLHEVQRLPSKWNYVSFFRKSNENTAYFRLWQFHQDH